MNVPVEAVLPELLNVLRRERNAVLIAPPGAGKTTRVPLALLKEPWLDGKRILMLEPRRIAARAAAAYMASLLGEKTGETVGYRMRSDTKVGPKTRIEVITEGVLTRMLQRDPSLEGAGIVLFDEFHERNLAADLGLALCLQSQSLLREDLKLLVMSATLEGDAVAALMNGAPVVTSEGRMYPVETRYRREPVKGPVTAALLDTVLQAWREEEGDLLVFLPGAPEIRRAEKELAARLQAGQALVAPLYGSLTQEQQDRAILPDPQGRRKIVLATTIAETSLTVEGVRIVVDSGLVRVPRFSPRTGMSRLETTAVSRASADQRRGRAGRLAPGVCYRLWTEQEERRLAPAGRPEIAEADLAPLALDLAVWGARPDELAWLDAPPAAAYAQACSLLRRLGALDESGAVTAHGRKIAALGLHPRLAHMALMALPLGAGGLACELAALLGERDILRGTPSARDADLRLRAEALRAYSGPGRGSQRPPHDSAAAGTSAAEPESFADVAVPGSADASVLRRLGSDAARWKRELGVPEGESGSTERTGLLLAFAFPDRIAGQRSPGRFTLSSGRGAVLPDMQRLSSEPWLVCADLDDQGAESTIYLGAPVGRDELEEHFAHEIVEEITVNWDREAQAVRARKRTSLGMLTLREITIAAPDPELIKDALLQGVRSQGLEMLGWSKPAKQLRERLSFMAHHDDRWPDVSDEALLAALEDWLGPHVYGMKSRGDLQRLNLAAVLEAMLTWEQRRMLDEQAPTHLTVPSGSRIPVDYRMPEAPALYVRLQEMFGLQATPAIGGGRVPLTLHLLSPAQRPVQVTRDLESFWKEAYFEVKKDLKGRYPKHYWPDDPLEAIPTSRAKPRK
ncbi:ATP-dependent helicase HrpB [Paenibacillus sp. GbtcB18]|uniref:ATP-dependent helicase HrpB n=1 Tax=Paenibacillus sp. GbtcB18 TaxID=2824763 RepID=UPI001C30FED6|nr:ATP-dependent helicase HrpB [Paenibacillus sp. GbtcB18]